MEAVAPAPALAGLGLGIALAGAPGPVQAVLLQEGLRGGLRRGFRAMAGANLTFGALLVGLALGLSLVPPAGLALRALEGAGGAFLLWLAVDGIRSAGSAGAQPGRHELPAAARGAVAVLLNPGGWLFLGTAATALFTSAAQLGGRIGAVIAALALVVGLAVGDGAVVLFGGLGLRRAGALLRLWVRRALAALLGLLGIALALRGLLP